MTSPNGFKTRAERFVGVSSLDFLNYFKKDLPDATLHEIQDLYRAEDFTSIVKILSDNSLVVPTSTFKKRSNNFRYKSIYKIEQECDNGYIITGENYITRKYRKSNFNIVEV
jgi:hypothetical protein